MTAEATRICNKCKTAKPLNEDHYRLDRRRNTFRYTCRKCRAIENSEWRKKNKEWVNNYNAANKERKSQQAKEYRTKNVEKVTACKKKWREANREKEKERVKRYITLHKEEINERNRQRYQLYKGLHPYQKKDRKPAMTKEQHRERDRIRYIENKETILKNCREYNRNAITNITDKYVKSKIRQHLARASIPGSTITHEQIEIMRLIISNKRLTKNNGRI